MAALASLELLRYVCYTEVNQSMITEKDVRRFISQSSDMVIEFVHGREYVKMFDSHY